MWTCGRSLQTALTVGLLLIIQHTRAESSQPFEAPSSVDIVSVDPGDLIFDQNGTLSFSTGELDPNLDARSLVQLSAPQPRRGVLEQTPVLNIESTRGGDFVVPIPAIGIGWTLLLGAGMIRVGCKVLRLKH